MTKRSLGYGRQLIGEDDVAAVAEVMRGERLTQGPCVERFESALAAYVGARYAVACANGTAALHLACLAAGVAPGGRCVTQTVTFVASANAAIYCGGDADLVDIDPNTLGMDVPALKAALAQRPDTKVVVPVHMAGLAADMAALREAAPSRIVIEDACHALGATYPQGDKVGSCRWTDMACFSFHPVKPITTGEGGAVTTNDPELYRRLLLFRSHGIERDTGRFVGSEIGPWCYEQQILGFNYRLNDMQAALGLSQLAKLDRFRTRRRDVAHRYDTAFDQLGMLRPLQARGDERARSGLHLYLVAIDFQGLGKTRTQVMNELQRAGVGTQVHYIPVHRQPFHRSRYDWRNDQFPAAEAYYAQCLSLPLSAALDEEDVEHVIAALYAVLGQTAGQLTRQSSL